MNNNVLMIRKLEEGWSVMVLNNGPMMIMLEEGWASMILNNGPKRMRLEEGWACLQKDITKLKNLLEGGPKFTPDEYMSFYTAVYNMCTVVPGRGYLQEVHDKYRGIYEEYIGTTILPALRERRDEAMLRELMKRWKNHWIMVRLLSHFFTVLERVFMKGRTGGLSEVGFQCFRDVVYAEVKNDFKDAVIALIDRERDGEQIDRALLTNVGMFFVEMGGTVDVYKGDFEAAMLANTTTYYSRKAASWIEQDSYSEYTLKAELCLKREEERARHYLPLSSDPYVLVEIARLELFTKNQAELSAKQTAGSNAQLEG